MKTTLKRIVNQYSAFSISSILLSYLFYKTIPINNFNEIWWEEINSGSGRDQLSQSYASWKSNIKIDPIMIGKNIYTTPLLSLKAPHIKIK